MRTCTDFRISYICDFRCATCSLTGKQRAPQRLGRALKNPGRRTFWVILSCFCSSSMQIEIFFSHFSLSLVILVLFHEFQQSGMLFAWLFAYIYIYIYVVNPCAYLCSSVHVLNQSWSGNFSWPRLRLKLSSLQKRPAAAAGQNKTEWGSVDADSLGFSPRTGIGSKIMLFALSPAIFVEITWLKFVKERSNQQDSPADAWDDALFFFGFSQCKFFVDPQLECFTRQKSKSSCWMCPYHRTENLRPSAGRSQRSVGER